MAGKIHRQETVDCLRKFNARRKLKVIDLDRYTEREKEDLSVQLFFFFCFSVDIFSFFCLHYEVIVSADKAN